MNKEFKYSIYILLTFLIIYSCAVASNPTGGPEDEYPPEILKYSLENESKNVPVDIDQIKIEFDEYIKLSDATNQIVISPPMDIIPTFSPLGYPQKYLTIKFNESLKENTTYSINFGQSIEDNNEGNKLSNFQYVFSTGETIDSLTFSGKINDIKSLEFDDKVYVGLYKIDKYYTDSTIFKHKPYYVTRPDSLGNFKFNYLHEGKYFLMGSSDGNHNLKYDPVIDKLAFQNEYITLPSLENPSLKLFKEKDKFAIKSPSYKEWGKVIFEFLGNPVNVKVKNRSNEYAEGLEIPSKTRDSLIYWFKPLAKDTLKESKKDTMSFFVFNNDEVKDTITFKKKIRFRVKKLKMELLRSEDDFSTLDFLSETPITVVDKKFIKVLKDSTKIDFNIVQEDNKPYSFGIDFKKKFEGNYKIDMFPGAVKDFFDETIDTVSYNQRVLKEQDYANLEIAIKNKPESKFWLHLLENKVIKREVYTDENIINIKAIKPGTYTLQMIIDYNNNGVWDTGDYLNKIQPERYLFNQDEILLNAYWDLKKTWDLSKDIFIKEDDNVETKPNNQ